MRTLQELGLAAQVCTGDDVLKVTAEELQAINEMVDHWGEQPVWVRLTWQLALQHRTCPPLTNLPVLVVREEEL